LETLRALRGDPDFVEFYVGLTARNDLALSAEGVVSRGLLGSVSLATRLDLRRASQVNLSLSARRSAGCTLSFRSVMLISKEGCNSQFGRISLGFRAIAD